MAEHYWVLRGRSQDLDTVVLPLMLTRGADGVLRGVAGSLQYDAVVEPVDVGRVLGLLLRVAETSGGRLWEYPTHREITSETLDAHVAWLTSTG